MYRFLFLAASMIFISCGDTRKSIKNEFLPNARGEADEIILVIDSTQWADTVGLGMEIKKTFLAPMRGLPQDEPLFNVSKVNPKKLNSTLKSATNMIFVTTLDSKTSQSRAIQNYFTDQALNKIKRDTSEFMRARKDVFARGQNVMFLFASSEDFLAEKIKMNRSRIQSFFEESARSVIQGKIFGSTEKELMSQLNDDLGVKLTIPYGYSRAKNLKNFVWYRKMDAETEQSLFIYFEPYRSQSLFNEIDVLRDKITTTFLRDSEKPSLHIKRQEQINVFTERVNFNGNFAVEARGLWKISDNSGGGPFVSYTIIDETNGMAYYVEGYAYSPGTKKKNLIRELEAILGTFQTPGDLAKTSAKAAFY